MQDVFFIFFVISSPRFRLVKSHRARTAFGFARLPVFPMKLRFFLDYSDYRSYLMMHALRALDALPIAIQWVVLDAYSLRALSGTSRSSLSKLEREYEKREALRYCAREGIEFVWQDEKIHLGMPLRAAAWMSAHAPQCLEPFSRKILEMIWGRGIKPDHNDLQNMLKALDLGESGLSPSFEKEAFQVQDSLLREAIADGIFDVPSLLIGDQMFAHFDAAHEMRRLALLECLRKIPQNIVYNAFATELMTRSNDSCRRCLDEMVRKNEASQSTLLVMDQGFKIKHLLDIPEYPWIVERPAPPTNLGGFYVDAHDIASALRKSRVGALNFGILNDVTSVENLRFDGRGDFLFCTPIRRAERDAFLVLFVDETGKIHEISAPSKDRDALSTALGGWNIAAIDPNVHDDLNVYRLAAIDGMHLCCRMGDKSPIAESAGCLANTWILEFCGEKIFVVDSAAHRRELRRGQAVEFTINPLLPDAKVWKPTAPRTLLLCDQSLKLGDIVENDDLGFAVRGTSLVVSAPTQRSEISPIRVFDLVRIRNRVIVIVPLFAEMVSRTEAVSQRFIQMLNRAPREGMPIFVNYWNELEFEMLEKMRPVLAATSQMFLVPIVLVVGVQIVEVWLPGNFKMAWRLEKEGEHYALDLSEMTPCERIFDDMLAALETNEESFIGRLRRFEK